MGFLLNRVIQINARSLCTHNRNIMKYLCVAEKNDAAKNIASLLSRGHSNRREGLSVYNKIYEFNYRIMGQDSELIMTSVTGHLLNYKFHSSFKNWESCNPVQLFEAPIHKYCPEDNEKIKKTLEREARKCQGLIIWTDCDREGENIGYEVIKVCTDVKPNLQVYRAKFSEITLHSVQRALNNLERPNQNVSDAVDVRQELDLRTGAAFTRLQTLRFCKVFPRNLSNKLISYGSCQFPTLGFVVERYQALENFIPERFWKIIMNHVVKDLKTDFNWKRERLFEKTSVEAILDICKENPIATIESVDSKPKSKWRPLPLDTVEMEKTISRKLRINAKEVMKIAEKLYNQGFISYPRTETNSFPKGLNLQPLVEMQKEDHEWGIFANRIFAEWGGPNPRQGKKSDQAHPPIHPIKYTNTLQGNEKRVYEFIVRHFLACVSKDALGHETTVVADISGEKFTAKGLMILERNYLDVYVYEKWNAKEINQYQMGDTFTPTNLDMVESSTSPPKLLTEADLIALMEKHGIGTDATHAEHIETIKSREYVGMHENIYFVPATLGMGLVEGYNNIGLEISLAKPTLRADFENDLKLISEGRKNAEVVRAEQVQKYKEVFQMVAEKMRLIDESLATRLNANPEVIPESALVTNHRKSVLKCPKCGFDMILRTKKNEQGYYIGCSNYPDCKNAVWFSSGISNMEVQDESCNHCGPDVKKLKIHFRQNPFLGEPNPSILCIGGCDRAVLSTLDIPLSSVKTDNNAPPRQPANVPRPPANVANNQRTITNWTNNTNATNVHNNQQTNNTNGIPETRTNNAFRNNYQQRQTPSTSQNNHSLIGNTTMLNSSVAQTAVGDDEIVCHCNKAAILLTVRKEGPNKGRQFYKCVDGTNNGGCDFFLWDTENDRANPDNSNNTARNGDAQLKCNCYMDAVERTVNKEGPNKGRKFYCCPKPMNEGCNFFKWADDVDDNGGGDGGGGDGWGGGGGGGRGGRGRANYRGGKSKTTGRARGARSNGAPYKAKGAPRGKRKCGNCGQEGHQRNRCPNV